MPRKEKSAPPRAVAAKPARTVVARASAAKAAPVTAPKAKAQPETVAVAAPPPAPKVAPPTAPVKPAPAPLAKPPVAPVAAAAAAVAATVPAPIPAPAPAASRMAIPSAEALPKAFKGVTGTNFAQARDTFSTMRQSTDAFAAGLSSGGEAAAKGLQSLQTALVEALQANADATMGYWRSLGSVKSLSEAIELQAQTARKQFEAFNSQARTLAGIANRTAQEVSAPVRRALDSALNRSS